MLMNHFYHLVEKSPWPLLCAMSIFTLVSSLVELFVSNKFFMLMVSTSCILVILYKWWQDVVRESTFQGNHSMKVVKGLQMGMLLFIVSEVMFFFSFFWSFFHSSLSVLESLGGVWPPVAIFSFNPFSIPLLNTIILLTSGVSLTWSHHSLMNSNHSDAMNGLIKTILLGLFFTVIQGFEYMEASFCLSDSVYGSVFFVATGFHGLHVIIGNIFLFICLVRMINNNFSGKHHIGFEFSTWYWHFVDIVWLFLYSFVYWWSA